MNTVYVLLSDGATRLRLPLVPTETLRVWDAGRLINWHQRGGQVRVPYESILVIKVIPYQDRHGNAPGIAHLQNVVVPSEDLADGSWSRI